MSQWTSAAIDKLAARVLELEATHKNALHEDVAGEIHGLTEKTVPVGADELLIEDSAASYAKKRVELGNIVKTGFWNRIIRNPTVGPDYYGIGFTDRAITIKQIRMVILGGTAISVNLRYGARNTSGTYFQSGWITNKATGADETIVVSAIPADQQIWVKCAAMTGTVTELGIFIRYEYL